MPPRPRRSIWPWARPIRGPRVRPPPSISSWRPGKAIRTAPPARRRGADCATSPPHSISWPRSPNWPSRSRMPTCGAWRKRVSRPRRRTYADLADGAAYLANVSDRALRRSGHPAPERARRGSLRRAPALPVGRRPDEGDGPHPAHPHPRTALAGSLAADGESHPAGLTGRDDRTGRPARTGDGTGFADCGREKWCPGPDSNQ